MLKTIFLALCITSFSSIRAMESLERILVQTKNVDYAKNKEFYFEGQVKGDFFQTLFKDTDNLQLAELVADSFKDELPNTKGLKLPVKYFIEVIGLPSILDEDKIEKVSLIKSIRITVGEAMIEKVSMMNSNTFNYEIVDVIPEDADKDLVFPIKHKRISSPFLLIRKHPVKKRRIQPHKGVDFTAISGTPVYPAKDGEVVHLGRTRAKGNFVIIEHNNGMKTTYDHLRRFEKGLSVGDFVTTQDQIGEVGRTGYATGAHLHFGLINQDGWYIDPSHYFKEAAEISATSESNEMIDELESELEN